MRTECDLLKEAWLVQDACNLSGVVHSFGQVVSELWEHAREKGMGTEWVNQHPVCVLFADKMASLTRCNERAMDALNLAANVLDNGQIKHGEKTSWSAA